MSDAVAPITDHVNGASPPPATTPTKGKGKPTPKPNAKPAAQEEVKKEKPPVIYGKGDLEKRLAGYRQGVMELREQETALKAQLADVSLRIERSIGALLELSNLLQVEPPVEE